MPYKSQCFKGVIGPYFLHSCVNIFFSPRASRSISLKVVHFVLLVVVSVVTFCKNSKFQYLSTDGAYSVAISTVLVLLVLV